MLIALVVSAMADDSTFDHDHAQLAAVLDGAVYGSGVDYAVFSSRQHTLDAYLASIADAPVDTFSPAQQLAFWINAYNALTIDLILDNQPIGSIRDLDDGNPWDARRFRVAGAELTLNDIEHRRVRQLGDARIHAAVNCASTGCPPLPPSPIRAAHLGTDLNAAARRWVSTNAYMFQADGVAVNNIFEWYGEDFQVWAAGRDVTVDQPHDATIAFLTHFGADWGDRPTDAAAISVSVFDYDWSLNQR